MKMLYICDLGKLWVATPYFLASKEHEEKELQSNTCNLFRVSSSLISNSLQGKMQLDQKVINS